MTASTVAATGPARPTPPGAAPVDWTVAARVAARLVPPNPAARRETVSDLVGDLRRAADDAVAHVREVTAMVPARDDLPVSRVLVVDRVDWVRANTEMLDRLTADLPVRPGERGPSRVSRLAGGLQVGGVLAALSTKVLGQFDPFSARPGGPGTPPEPGRLLLVAPNVLQVERVLRVDPADFRLWVALHEQTHALQFATAPWLGEHLRMRMASVVAGLTDDGTGEGAGDARADERVRSLLAGAVRVARGTDHGGLTALLPPDTRRVVDEVGAVMSLLEGHADVAMDAVGRTVVPSVRQIRTRFERRRAGSHGVASVVLRRVLGLDLKLAQYRDGARFVRRVRRAVGTDGLNAVWAGPANLPTVAEIADHRLWVRRVHG
jgi:coenzyme F420 biosynthesis associated uncharacterized protein